MYLLAIFCATLTITNAAVIGQQALAYSAASALAPTLAYSTAPVVGAPYSAALNPYSALPALAPVALARAPAATYSYTFNSRNAVGFAPAGYAYAAAPAGVNINAAPVALAAPAGVTYAAATAYPQPVAAYPQSVAAYPQSVAAFPQPVALNTFG